MLYGQETVTVSLHSGQSNVASSSRGGGGDTAVHPINHVPLDKS